jgi:hypothetical protein
MLPTKESVIRRIREYRKRGRKAFLDDYAARRGAKAHYILHDGDFYDLKAIWAAAHDPPVTPASFKHSNCSKPLR